MDDRGYTHSALGATAIGLLVALQLYCFGARPTGPRRAVRYAALAAQVLLVVLPFVLLDHAWISLTGLVAGNALALAPPTAGRVAAAAAVVAAGTLRALVGVGPVDVALTVAATAATGLVVHRLARPPDRVADELVAAALAEERRRVSRDLHDVLGYSLSAIKLKCELGSRYVLDNPERARVELAEIQDVTRRALSDMRSVARSYRPLSLEDSVRSARAVLTAAEIEPRIEIDLDDVAEDAAEVLATVLREGVTNVLRHSKATFCEITVRRTRGSVELDIVNDGADHDPHDRSGSGVLNLAERVHEVGGRFTARLVDGDRFELHASIPTA